MAEQNITTLTRLTLANTAMLVVNSLLLIGLLLRSAPGPAPATSAAPVLPAPASTASSATLRPVSAAPAGGEGVEGFLMATIRPLREAAEDHRIATAGLLPDDAAVAAAVRSDSLSSAETRAVLDTLRTGYARFNMPFPELKIPESPSGAPSQGSDAADGQAIAAWIAPTVARLAEELESKGERDAGLLPTEAEIAAAVESDRLDSAESRWVIDKLKNGYARLDLDFPEPGAAAPPPVTGGGGIEQDMLRAYFEANLQRLKLMASKQGVDAASVLPEDAVIEAAITSGDITSAAARPALDQLREGFAQVGLEFREPVLPQ